MKKQLLLALLSVFGNIATKTTTVIIAFSVLFEPNEGQIEKHIRSKLGIARSIGLLFSGIPTKEETKKAYFEILDSIPVKNLQRGTSLQQAIKTPYFPWEKEYAFPKILRYHVLTKTLQQEQETYQKVSQNLESMRNVPTSKKRIYQGLIDFLFQSEKMNPIMQPVEPIVNLMRSLKNQGYTLILIGNVPGYAWETFVRDYPQAHIIPELFKKENIFISGVEGVLAQSEEMYTKIITQKKLNPRECIVIESNPNNVKYPKKLKMKTIIFNTLHYKFKSFNATFQKLLTSEPKEII